MGEGDALPMANANPIRQLFHGKNILQKRRGRGLVIYLHIGRGLWAKMPLANKEYFGERREIKE
jgi:hypothetical protein